MSSTPPPAPCLWHGEDAVRHVGGEGLTAVVVPGRGAKIASLVDGSGREWLAQPALPLDPPARGPVSFVDAEMCGWDECVPTVDADVLDGTALPDHGEAWSRPWTPTGDGAWGYDGDVLPYRFERAVRATTSGLRLEYRAEATGDRAVPFLWAAHPQLLTGPGAHVVLPADVTHVIGIHGVIGRQPWGPELAAVDSVADGASQKVWTDPAQPAGWAELYLAEGSVLRMSWDVDVLPYLALWTDAADFSRERVIAFEPATAGTEAPSRAVTQGTCRLLEPGEPLTWWVDLEVWA